MPDEIIEADEIFITGSAVEIQPIIKLGNKDFAVGPITLHMIKEYQKLVIDKK